ncbi:hypothetical protein SLEP1_g58280 [Rubroshorea leprosula]|uniref:DUF4220 domain-containing protein n=1 Tax=Rubroshorea leprosula TaxID=152421 RepID=A0AAV5MR86_9ROSI|nr:hypothetical protein SLEP1_g58280 [Rubroshorea leprosula]
MFNFQGHSDPNENQTFDRFHKEHPNVLSGYLFFAIMRSDVNDYLSTQNLPDVGTRIKTYLRETVGIDGRRALGFASEYFPVSHANDHFVINSIQLGFMFDVVYTKASLIYTKLGCFLRLTSFTSSFSVLLLFFINIINEPKFHGSRIDIATTGISLSGAIAQELYAAWIMLSSNQAVLVAEFHHNVLVCKLFKVISKYFPCLLHQGRHRKYKINHFFKAILWFAYFGADWIAIATLGKLSGSYAESTTTNVFRAYWAPLLLVHLGGPDTITAYAFEDNKLWIRHLVILVVKVIFVIYVVCLSWTFSWLWFLTLPLILAGIIKYVEKIFCLKLNNSQKTKPIISNMFNLRGHSNLDKNQALDRLQKENPYILGGYLLFTIMRPDVNDYLSSKNLSDVGTRIKAYLRETTGVDGRRAFEFAGEYSSRGFEERASEIFSIQLGFMFDVVYTKAMMACQAVANIVKSSLGLVGLDKMQVLVELAELQDRELVTAEDDTIILIGEDAGVRVRNAVTAFVAAEELVGEADVAAHAANSLKSHHC